MSQSPELNIILNNTRKDDLKLVTKRILGTTWDSSFKLPEYLTNDTEVPFKATNASDTPYKGEIIYTPDGGATELVIGFTINGAGPYLFFPDINGPNAGNWQLHGFFGSAPGECTLRAVLS